MTQPAENIDTRQRTLCLIDVSGLFWRHWHASGDEAIGVAFERTVAEVRRRADGFDYVAVCCDAPPYKRKELSPDYKAQRDKPEAVAVEQFRRVRDRLRADGFLLWGVRGYEADDVIATACRYARTDDLAVTIASADKDLLQLVTPSVCVVSPMTGTRYVHGAADGENCASVVDKFGVSPALVGDLLALMGDASDNVRGVRGIGAKTAAKLIQEIGPLDDILTAAADNDDRIKPKQREALNAAAADVRISRQLVKLYADVPINWAELYEERTPQPLTEKLDWDKDTMGTTDTVHDAELESAPQAMPVAPPAAAVTEVIAPPAADSAPDTTAIVPIAPSFERALEPQNTRSAWKLSEVLHESRLFPQFRSPHAIMAVVLVGRNLGLNSVQSLMGFDMIKDKPSPKTITLIGRIKASPLCRYWRMVSSNAERAVFETLRVGDPEPTRYEMTIEEAKQAGWAANDQWRKQPATMLRWRCESTLARIVYPDIVAGLYTAEEMRDVEG